MIFGVGLFGCKVNPNADQISKDPTCTFQMQMVFWLVLSHTSFSFLLISMTYIYWWLVVSETRFVLPKASSHVDSLCYHNQDWTIQSLTPKALGDICFYYDSISKVKSRIIPIIPLIYFLRKVPFEFL